MSIASVNVSSNLSPSRFHRGQRRLLRHLMAIGVPIFGESGWAEELRFEQTGEPRSVLFGRPAQLDGQQLVRLWTHLVA